MLICLKKMLSQSGIDRFSIFSLLIEYYRFRWPRLKHHITQYPLGTGFRKISLNNKDYHPRAFADSRRNIRLASNADCLKISSEIVSGTKYYKNIIMKFECSTLVPVYPAHGSNLTINIIDENKNVLSITKVEDSDRHTWIKIPAGGQLHLESKCHFFCGNGVALKQFKETKRDLVLVLFIDGLVDRSELEIEELSDLMPNTAAFFSTGIDFRKNYANAEWTLPSVPTFMTGCYTQGHGLFHPEKTSPINSNITMISEHFQSAGYNTLNVGGNWRVSPPYGYPRGFDRTIYRNSMTASEVIQAFIENNRAFKGRSQFAFLTFFDLHHDLNQNLGLDVISSLSNFDDDSIRVEKSVNAPKSLKKIEIYKEKIKSLDATLGLLYKYLEGLCKSNITVSLVSDHGQSFISSNDNILSDARCHIPWLFKSPSVKCGFECEEYTENVDIFGVMLNDCGIEYRSGDTKSIEPKCLAGQGRNFSFSQSIYPGQKYKAMWRFNQENIYFESNELVLTDGSFKLNDKEVASFFSKYENVFGANLVEIKAEFMSSIKGCPICGTNK